MTILDFPQLPYRKILFSNFLLSKMYTQLLSTRFSSKTIYESNISTFAERRLRRRKKISATTDFQNLKYHYFFLVSVLHFTVQCVIQYKMQLMFIHLKVFVMSSIARVRALRQIIDCYDQFFHFNSPFGIDRVSSQLEEIFDHQVLVMQTHYEDNVYLFYHIFTCRF